MARRLLFVALACLVAVEAGESAAFGSEADSVAQSVVRPTVFSDMNAPDAAQTSPQQQSQLQSSHPSSAASTLADAPPAPSSKISPLKSRFCQSLAGGRLEAPLGMQTLHIDDLALSASSYSNEQVGPHLARLNLDISGGAWCPGKPISVSNFGKEWIQVKLNRSYVISALETQGRFGMGNGKEFVPSYQVEYSRDSGRTWHKWKDFRGSSLLRANEDTNSPVRNELSPPIVGANVIRLLPFSQHLRTVCLRFELHGCAYDEGAPVAYATNDGVVEPRWGHLIDYTYDGLRRQTQLSQGLGQLVDGVRGADNFSHNNGFEWVGWKSMNGDVVIEFTFKTLRNFTGALVHSNNLFSAGVEVFQALDVHYGIEPLASVEPLRDALYEQRRRDALYRPQGALRVEPPGQSPATPTLWSQDVLSIEYEPDKKLESARPVMVHLKQRLANKLRFVLKFASKWILVSEFEFLSHPVELMSLSSLDATGASPELLFSALTPAKSYDEYVAVLREHQLRRIATNAYLESFGGAASEAPDSPAPSSFAPADLLAPTAGTPTGAWPTATGEPAPATNPLLGPQLFLPAAFGPPSPSFLAPEKRRQTLGAPHTVAGSEAGNKQPAGADEPAAKPARQLGSFTLGALGVLAVLLLLVLLLGLLFGLAPRRLRYVGGAQAAKLAARHAQLAGPSAKSAPEAGFPGGGPFERRGPLDAGHFNAVFATHQPAQNRSTLRRLATLAGKPHAPGRLADALGPRAHEYHLAPDYAHQPQPHQLLVSVKDHAHSLFGAGGVAPGSKSQAVSTQLIVGLNSSNPLAQQQIYSALQQQPVQQAANVRPGAHNYASAHYSAAMSLASSSTTTTAGQQADYDYAIPDATTTGPLLFPSSAHANQAAVFGARPPRQQQAHPLHHNHQLTTLIQPQVLHGPPQQQQHHHNYELIHQEPQQEQHSRTQSGCLAGSMTLAARRPSQRGPPPPPPPHPQLSPAGSAATATTSADSSTASSRDQSAFPQQSRAR